MIDAHSKELEVQMSSPTTTHEEVIRILGLPEVIVSDNATNFTSEKFKQFLTKNGWGEACQNPSGF